MVSVNVTCDDGKDCTINISTKSTALDMCKYVCSFKRALDPSLNLNPEHCCVALEDQDLSLEIISPDVNIHSLIYLNSGKSLKIFGMSVKNHQRYTKQFEEQVQAFSARFLQLSSSFSQFSVSYLENSNNGTPIDTSTPTKQSRIEIKEVSELANIIQSKYSLFISEMNDLLYETEQNSSSKIVKDCIKTAREYLLKGNINQVVQVLKTISSPSEVSDESSKGTTGKVQSQPSSPSPISLPEEGAGAKEEESETQNFQVSFLTGKKIFVELASPSLPPDESMESAVDEATVLLASEKATRPSIETETSNGNGKQLDGAQEEDGGGGSVGGKKKRDSVLLYAHLRKGSDFFEGQDSDDDDEALLLDAAPFPDAAALAKSALRLPSKDIGGPMKRVIMFASESESSGPADCAAASAPSQPTPAPREDPKPVSQLPRKISPGKKVAPAVRKEKERDRDPPLKDPPTARHPSPRKTGTLRQPADSSPSGLARTSLRGAGGAKPSSAK